MWIENRIFKEDMDEIANAPFLSWKAFKDKVIFVTGATGLIGFNLVSALLYASEVHHLGLKVLALVRSRKKAENRFHEILVSGLPLGFVEGTLTDIPPVEGNIDFIIHGASPTASRYFAEHPVETIQDNFAGASRLLELAKAKRTESILFLSSMEVYGSLHRQEKVDETHECFIDTMNPRSSYPEVKRMIEALFASYAAEYHVPAKVIRLTQTFGAGVRDNDNRVFAQFMRSAMAGNDIILLTKGGTRRCYLYTADAVAAILTVLLKGKAGEAYNAANESTYVSIREMAEAVASLPLVTKHTGKKPAVKIQMSPETARLYPPELYMDLDTSKLRALGWKAERNLKEMLERMIQTCYLTVDK